MKEAALLACAVAAVIALLPIAECQRGRTYLEESEVRLLGRRQTLKEGVT